MSAPKGNRFWEQRSKHGRDKIFTDPQVMWLAACEYFEWCEDNPLIAVEQTRGRGTPRLDVTTEGIQVVDSSLIELPKMRAFTWQGLAMFIEVDVKTLWDYGKSETHKDFHPTISRMDDVIYRQKYEGAASGLLNPSFIGRDIGQVEMSKIEHSGTIETITGMKIIDGNKS